MYAMICALSLSGLFGFTESIGTIQVVLFVGGLLLLFAEMFMPGFGIAAACGTIMLIAGIIMTAETVLQAFVMVLILVLLLAFVLFIILRSAKKGKLSKILVLRTAMSKEKGYSAAEDRSALAGKTGVALTLRRPSGTAEFDGKRYDVVSEGRFIEQGTKITVIYTEGRRIVVKPAE